MKIKKRKKKNIYEFLKGKSTGETQSPPSLIGTGAGTITSA